jgi:hypothetical protein
VRLVEGGKEMARGTRPMIDFIRSSTCRCALLPPDRRVRTLLVEDPVRDEHFLQDIRTSR